MFHLHMQLGAEDGTECSETSAYKIQTPGNYPQECIQNVTNYTKYIDLPLEQPAEHYSGEAPNGT